MFSAKYLINVGGAIKKRTGGIIVEKNSNAVLPEDLSRPISLKNDVLVMELKKELLLYDLGRNKAFCLNEISEMVWNLCDGENTAEDIRRQVSIQLKTQVPEDIIRLALYDLKNEQLLSNHQDVKVNFNGLSRREVIRKMGLATMIALPVISTLLAPTAASAQSVAGVCDSTMSCFCQDASCTSAQLGNPSLLQTPCVNVNCSNSGGNNCLCVGRFICSATNGLRLGRCGLV